MNYTFSFAEKIELLHNIPFYALVVFSAFLALLGALSGYERAGYIYLTIIGVVLIWFLFDKAIKNPDAKSEVVESVEGLSYTEKFFMPRWGVSKEVCIFTSIGLGLLWFILMWGFVLRSAVTQNDGMFPIPQLFGFFTDLPLNSLFLWWNSLNIPEWVILGVMFIVSLVLLTLLYFRVIDLKGFFIFLSFTFLFGGFFVILGFIEPGRVLFWLLVTFTAATFEELFVHGQVFPSVWGLFKSSWVGLPIAMGISGLCFVAFHGFVYGNFPNWIYFRAFLHSVISCLIYALTGSGYGSVISHMAHNAYVQGLVSVPLLWS